ncbi:MAG: alpha/beta fold hydrolase [Candidatus Binatia bacterium]
MATPIKMPKFGMTMTEGTVVEWRSDLGSTVERGAILLVIESEKAEIEVEATASGRLRHLYVEPGETVPCGTLLAALTDTDEEAFDAEAFRAEHDTPEPATTAPTSSPHAALPSSGTPPAAASRSGVESGEREVRKAVAPAARALARKLGLDTDAIPGTGPGGRVTRTDIEAWAAARETLVEVAPGVSLEVPTLGEGERVLLLPGFGTDVSAFAPQSAVLAEGYRVLGINPRGVGLSDASDESTYPPALLARDACAVLDEPAHVIGASMGATVALEMAIARPEWVRSLTLITPALHVSPRLRAVLSAWCALAGSVAPDVLAGTLLPWLFGDVVLGDERARLRMQRGLGEIVARIPSPVLQRYAAGLGAWAGSRTADLGSVATPTLVIMAENDLMTGGAGPLTAMIPGARVVVVPGAGHAVCLEAAEAVNEAILVHLASAGGHAS